MFANLRRDFLIALSYALTGWAALQIAVPPGYAAPLFPPAGIALAAMLAIGPRALPAIFVGAMGVQLLAAEQSGLVGFAWLATAAIALGASLQSWVSYRLLQRWVGLPNALDSQESILRFVALVAPLGSLVNASIAIAVLTATGLFAVDEIFFNWVNWWAGDTLGVLLMVPLVLVFFGQPAEDWRPRRLGVALPMGVALSLLAIAFLQVRDWEVGRLQAQFNRDAEFVGTQISRRLEAQLDQVLALQRLATVHPALSRDVWRRFTEPLLARYPGTHNFGWSPLVEDASRRSFEAKVRAGDIADFAILGRDPAGRTFVAAPAERYLPILFVEPLANNRSVVGLDPLVLPSTARAAQQTLESALPVASAPIRLVQERGEQRGVVVYQAASDPVSGALLGMVSAVFRMDDAIGAALGPAAAEHVDVCLVDHSQPEALERLYGPVDCNAESWSGARLQWKKDLQFAGRPWTLTVVATPAYMQNLRSWGVWLMLAVGLFSTAILGAFLLLTSGRARRIELLVQERTQQLAEASHRLSAQQEELLQAQRIARLGSWEELPGRPIWSCSDELLLNLGLPENARVDRRRLLECINSEDVPALRHALDKVAGQPGEVALDCRLLASHLNPRVLHFRIESDGDPANGLRIRGTAQDVTAAREAEAHIAYLAHYDVLTGLPNRTLWNERIDGELRNALRHGDILAVLFLDLDHFKAVNDSLGHPVGDQLLTCVAQRLAECLRENDVLARLGGDEFVILLPRISHREDAALVARKLISALQAPMLIEGHELSISVSIGIALYPDDGEDASSLLKHADVAMYSAKDQGRNAYHYFKPEMDKHALERLMLENALRRAVERNELVLHYQPQVSAVDGQLQGVEALLRWRHPDLGMVPPLQFIGLAEESGLIVKIGEWVLETACRQQVAWAAAGMPLLMAVNISALQFRLVDFAQTVQRIVLDSGIAPDCLELELTESALMQPTPEVLERMQHLRDAGIRLALDDFGTGYSSLSYLKRLPIHRLKIDRGFVRDLPDDVEDAAIAMATLSLARDLGMQVVAEGVENAAQRAFLVERGCQSMQGYLFSTPLPADELFNWHKTRPV